VKFESAKVFMLFFGIMLGVALGTLERMVEPYVVASLDGSSDARLLLVGGFLGLIAAFYVMKFH